MRVCLLLAVVLACTNAPSTAAETPLRWRLVPGTRLNVRLTQTTRTETTVKDAVTAVQIESGFDLLWAIDRVDEDGTLRLTQTFTRLWLKTVAPDGKTSVYDSASREEPAAEAAAIAGAVRTLLRMHINLSLSCRGEVLAAQRNAEMDSLLGDLPALAGWKTLLTKEGMSRTLQQALGILPEAPVKVGDQWIREREIQTPLGRIAATETYAYEGRTDDGERMLEKIRVATDVKRAAKEPSPAEAEKLPRQHLEGVYLFDAAAGFLAVSNLTQTLLTEVPYAGDQIQVKTTSTLRTEVTRKGERRA